MEKRRTWKPIAAGILDIVAALYGLILDWFFIESFMIVYAMVDTITTAYHVQYSIGGGGKFLIGLIFFLIITAIALTGGINAIKRKKWGWALTGSIVTILAPFINMIRPIQRLEYFSRNFTTFHMTPWIFRTFLLVPITRSSILLLIGIVAIVLTALSKKEFE